MVLIRTQENISKQGAHKASYV